MLKNQAKVGDNHPSVDNGDILGRGTLNSAMVDLVILG